MPHTMNPPLLDRLSGVIRAVFDCPDLEITRETSALDVDGWDSLTHTVLLLRVESEFGVRLPLDRTGALANVGELADVLRPLVAGDDVPGVRDDRTQWIILHGNCQMQYLADLLQ